ncbi:Octicosapeptide/Phox/Bem1p family protein [Raphanus sativus]|uniref:Uncharacterized protein LOC108858412 n=1 Tax=Raphanus sativus TaxID=3726 RepID=A0A6J0NUM3_RAPSA|nr:uncharacterized protein LOC108858412 [Raphanus sativus]KAJ4908306.1 Octicosapeptide/Phox/Bem1p family protein [Raphanus sativus]
MTTTVYSASASTVTEGAKGVMITPKCNNNKTNGKLRVVCRYGGSIVSQRYVGGDTRIVAVPPSAETSFASLVSHLAAKLGVAYDFKVKYQLPDQELDSLISLETDEDAQIMMEEHGYLTCESSSSVSKTRIRLFIFPLKTSASQGGLAQCKVAGDVDWLGVGEESKPEVTKPAVLQHPKTETWFVDALKSAEMMQAQGPSSGDGNGGICGQESMMLETNSAFGSSSSSVSSSNLPPVKSSGEDNTLASQVKFVPVESVSSRDNIAVTQISSHELPTRPHVLELNKPVPVPMSGYPPFLNQAQQQHTHVVYTGQPPHITGTSPMTLPPTTYHHTNHVHYQPLPQPYPIYYNPVDQYSSRQVQAPPVQHSTVLNTHQVDSPMVPLAPQIYPPPKPVDSLVQTSNDQAAFSSTTCRDDLIYNIDHLDDDTACALIYKTQPPAPIIPSQFQNMMLPEAFGKLRTQHNG